MRVAMFSAKSYERTLLDELNSCHRHAPRTRDGLAGGPRRSPMMRAKMVPIFPPPTQRWYACCRYES